jgi:2-polyprenyl-6-methoxyphenol hydroxylase-like FAD-dependent oxidoreductase
MSFTRKERIVIAGGGLGGLAAAVALLREGFQVAIFEKSAELREVGAGLSVWPNATRVLQKLGLLDEALRRSELIEHLGLRTWRGERLWEIAVRGRCETPAICIHRADLMAILKSRVPEESVHLGERLVGFDEREAEVTARFSSGRTAQADALIGADGIQSTVRALILGESKPIYRGYQAWRGVAQCAPAGHPSTTAIEFWGHGKRFGMESLGRGRTFWYATVNAPQGTLGDPAGWKDEAREHFQGWASPIQELIESTEPGAILKHEIEDRPPVKRWGRGLVTLLGDAAHLAAVGLRSLGHLPRDNGPAPGRLRAPCKRLARGYESRRYARTAFLTREARRIGRLGQLENRFAVALRTFALRLLPSFFSEMRHRKYFSFEG